MNPQIGDIVAGCRAFAKTAHNAHNDIVASKFYEIADKLEALGGWQAPAGWKLVPIEPNWDMRNEGREFLIDGIEKEPEKLAYFLWKTMINASPLPAPPKESCDGL